MKKKEIYKLFIKTLSETVKKQDIYTTGRKNSKLVEVYVTKIADVLFYNHSWESFDSTTIYRKKYKKWCDMGIIDMLYCQLYENYCSCRLFKQLYVDSKVVQNFNCFDDFIKHYYKIKSKKQIKMHAVTDNNNVFHSLIFTPPTVHDVVVIPFLVKSINCKLAKKVYIAGDKGYVTKDDRYKKRQRDKTIEIKIVSPKKDNQIQSKRLNTEKRKLLDKRYISEQTFAHLVRTYQRLDKLYEKTLKGYENMIKMSQICQILRKSNL